MRIFILLLMLGFYFQPAAQSTNLLPVDTWEAGSGSVDIFGRNGNVEENIRAMGEGPRGTNVLLWQGVTSGDGQADGGWNANFPIDHKKTYRYTVWLKKTDNLYCGNSYLGANNSNTLNLDGTDNNNPYFWYGSLPELDKWYLLVGYVHGSDYVGTKNYGGIYDGLTGNKVVGITDFKNKPTATTQTHRSYLFYCNQAGVSQYFYGPRVEEVNGNEVPVDGILEHSTVGRNLIASEDWSLGDGHIGDFIANGSVGENYRIVDKGPYGNPVLLWEGRTSGDDQGDGGWDYEFPIDHTKSYRSMVWIKKSDNLTCGTSYFGASHASTLYLNGSENTNPYFWYGDLPEIDKWYLLVGYIHGSGHSGTTNYGGIYDGVSGKKVISITDYKNKPGAQVQRQRAYLFYCDQANVSQFFWAPRVEQITGNETRIEAFLPPPPPTTQNLLPIEDWEVGTGSVSSFVRIGNGNEDYRSIAEGPHGNPVILWEARSSGDGQADGGWETTFNIDHTKTYRYTMWIRKEDDLTCGNGYLGAHPSSTLSLAGAADPNPYFWYGTLPQLDRWYLLVGYVHGSGHTGTTHHGAIYDGETGTKIQTITDFKNIPGATEQRHRAYLFYCNQSNISQYYWAPRVEEVNGNEPTIAALLANNNELIWQQSQDVTYYESGGVGIGTSDVPADYKLAVEGKVITEEVNVQLKSDWPDYVFDSDYKLLSITKLSDYLKENKHLPEVPSTTEVKKNGVLLGEMDAMLLKKIEELTLYLIEQNKKIEELQKKVQTLKKK